MLIRQASRGAYVHRELSITPGVVRNADGSCAVQMGHTRVLCTAVVEEQKPSEYEDSGSGKILVEYSEFPLATQTRTSRLHQDRGLHEQAQYTIQQALSVCIDFRALNRHNVVIDCEVVQDDGSAVAAALSGSYVAAALALRAFSGLQRFSRYPLLCQAVGVTCGIFNGQVILDLDRIESRQAEVFGFFSFNSDNQLVHLSLKGERCTFSGAHVEQLTNAASEGAQMLFLAQQSVLDKGYSHLHAVA